MVGRVGPPGRTGHVASRRSEIVGINKYTSNFNLSNSEREKLLYARARKKKRCRSTTTDYDYDGTIRALWLFFPMTNKAHCFPPFCKLGVNKAIHIQILIKKLRPGAVLPDFTHTTNENVRNQLLGGNDPTEKLFCCTAARAPAFLFKWRQRIFCNQ